VTPETIHTTSPRKVRIATAVIFFISGFGYTTWASRIPSIQHQLHLNEAQLGAALFALPVGLMATMPLTNYLLNRVSSSRIILFGAIAFAITLGFLGYAAQYWQFIIVLLCFGSSRNLLNLSMNTESVAVQALYKKSIMTTFHGIWSLAGFGGAALGYLMVYANVLPVHHLLSVSTVLIVLAVAVYPNMLHQKPVPQPQKPVFSLPDKALLKFALICFASMACENIMYDWSGIYLHKAVHTSTTTATAGFVIFMITVTAGRFIGDRIVGRIGVKTLLQYSGVLILLGFILAVAMPYAITTITGFALVGFGTSCVVPLVFSQTGKSKTMGSASAMAALSTIGYMGFLIVPPFVGFIAQASSLRWSFAIIMLLGLVIVWMASKIKE
jgi:MFS family permease